MHKILKETNEYIYFLVKLNVWLVTQMVLIYKREQLKKRISNNHKIKVMK